MFTEMLIWVMETKAFHNYVEIFKPDFLHPESEKFDLLDTGKCIP